MRTIGITGGIGSGKSFVCRLMERMGIAIYDCDKEAKALYDKDEKLKADMIALFDEKLYATPEGTLDRSYLAELIFSDKALLQKVNALVHPAVRRDIDVWKAKQKHEGHSLAIIESAILLSSEGLRSRVDEVCVVIAPIELRIERAMRRDKADLASIRQRMAVQMSDEELTKYADYIIHNDNKQHLLPQIEDLIHGISTNSL